jgi:hypothetical protein
VESGQQDTLEARSVSARATFRGREREEFDGLVGMMCYALWKNKKTWVFNEVHQQHSPISMGMAAFSGGRIQPPQRFW